MKSMVKSLVYVFLTDISKKVFLNGRCSFTTKWAASTAQISGMGKTYQNFLHYIGL